MPIEIYGVIRHPVDRGSKFNNSVEYDLFSIHLKIKCLEDNNFDGIYLDCGGGGGGPDPIIVAGYVSALTSRLKFLLGHRAAFIAPTMAARKIATLDHLTSGQLAVQMMAADAMDGPEAQAEQAERSAEYVGIVKAILSADQPIDHDGKYYRFHAGYSEIKPVQPAGVPLHSDGGAAVTENGEAACADQWRTRQFALLLREDGDSADETSPDCADERGSDLGFPLIGTADQIIAALMQHYEDGVRRFIFASLGAVQDMARIGNEIVPTLRERAAQRDAERGIG